MVVSNIFLCSPHTWGNDPNLSNMFQMGWFNHQLEKSVAEKHPKLVAIHHFFPYHRIPDAGQAEDFFLREICSGDLLDDLTWGDQQRNLPQNKMM